MDYEEYRTGGMLTRLLGGGDEGQQSDDEIATTSHTTVSPTMSAYLATLTTLPGEIHLFNTSHLRHLGRYTFRLTCQLYTLIPPPILRPLFEFSDKPNSATLCDQGRKDG